MTNIIACVNQKGGTAKTTTTANLGIGLAQSGKRVLLIDTDPQGSLGISLGHPQPDALPITLSTLMMPFFLFAMYEKNGQPFEEILKNIIEVRVKRPAQRPYQRTGRKDFAQQYRVCQPDGHSRELLRRR